MTNENPQQPYQPHHPQQGGQPPYPPQYGQVQPWQPQQPYWPHPVVAPKSTGLAIFLGLLLPGLGCMYAGKAGLGIGILFAWIVSLVLIFLTIGIILVPLCWIASGVLGYTSAQKWNADHGIIS